MTRAAFLRCLALMVRSGVPLYRALLLMAGELPVCHELTRTLLEGKSLGIGMTRTRPYFSDFQCQMVRMAEQTGAMEDVLTRLADFEDRNVSMARRLAGALYYPVALAAVGTTILLLAPPLLFKSLLPALESGGQTLPGLTRAFLGMSRLMQSPWLWLVLLSFGWVARHRRLPRATCLALRESLLEIPGLGRLLRTVALARFARAFSLQTQAGIGPLVSLMTAARCAGDCLLLERIPRSVAALRDGASLHQALQEADYFPDSFLHMMAVGEETGDLAGMAGRLADMHDEDLENSAEAFAGWFEPLVMLAMGIAAGLTILALMLPLLKMMTAFL